MSLFELNGKYSFKSEEKRKEFACLSDSNLDLSEKLKDKVFKVTYISEEDQVLQIKDEETNECVSCDSARYLLDDEEFKYFEKV